MGSETKAWRYENMLIGLGEDLLRHEGDYYRKQRGGLSLPWWADEDFDNLWPRFVPMERVEQLLGFEIDDDAVMYRVPESNMELIDGIYPDGHKRAGTGYRMVTSGKLKVVFSDRNYNEEFGVFTNQGFKINQMRETLIELPSMILDQSKGELGVASALLMRGGAVGVVNLELPEAITIDKVDFTFRPSLTMVDAYNGELKIGAYLTARTAVCENGAAQYTRDAPQRFQLKHTGRHQERLGEMRNALGLIWSAVGDYEAQVNALADWRVTDKDWDALMNATVPILEEEREGGDSTSKVANQRAINGAVGKRDKLTELYTKDERAATWNGTGLGVLQAFNTWTTHEKTFRSSRRAGAVDAESAAVDEDADGGDGRGGTMVQLATATGVTTDRLERGWLNVLRGEQVKQDHRVLEMLADVQGVKLKDMVPV